MTDLNLIHETLLDVKESQGRIEALIETHIKDDDRIHLRQEEAINKLYAKSNANTLTLARYKGGLVVLSSLFTAACAAVGVDRFWS
jgi:hypothetical protein